MDGWNIGSHHSNCHRHPFRELNDQPWATDGWRWKAEIDRFGIKSKENQLTKSHDHKTGISSFHSYCHFLAHGRRIRHFSIIKKPSKICRCDGRWEGDKLFFQYPWGFQFLFHHDLTTGENFSSGNSSFKHSISSYFLGKRPLRTNEWQIDSEKDYSAMSPTPTAN